MLSTPPDRSRQSDPPAQDGGDVGWEAADLHAWHVLRPLLDAGGYLPWDAGAMRPAGLVEICNLVAREAPAVVVELGSGSSTVLLARLLRERGGHLQAIESHPGWADWVTGELEREGLTAHAEVSWVPLGPSPLASDGLEWFDASALEEALGSTQVDLLLVDGPPADGPGQGLARHPALPAFDPRLAQHAVVVLDDVVRRGEQAVLAGWEQDGPWRFSRRPSGIAIGRRAERA